MKTRLVGTRKLTSAQYNKLYHAFYDARSRCENPCNYYYSDYGGRGIRFLFTSLEEFIAAMGIAPEPSKKYSLGRIDNNGNYEPNNVEWQTYKQQVRNRRNSLYIRWQGQPRLFIECVEDTRINQNNLKYDTLFWRIFRQGWQIERAFQSKVGECLY